MVINQYLLQYVREAKEAKESQKDFDKYLKIARKGIKIMSNRKHSQTLVCFLMEEMIQFTLLKSMFQ